MRPVAILLLLASSQLAGAGLVAQPPAAAPEELPAAAFAARPVAIPGGEGGVGFDDLGFSAALGKVLVPAGRTGDLDLVDPASGEVVAIPGFGSAPEGVQGAHGHGEGTTSADFGRGLLFAVDHGSRKLDVVDPAERAIVASAPLAGEPDYVRWVELEGEIWVTEPGAEQIEVFRLPAGPAPTPARVATISVPGGPESLVIDTARGRGYTNLWTGTTVAIDLGKREPAARWPNGCEGSRGLALDARRGFLFVGCAEGKASVLDLGHDGAVLDALADGSGVDIIAFDAARSLLYLPGGRSATMAVLRVSDAGKLTLAATAETAPRAHCVTVDDRGQAWVCDPGGGRLLRFPSPGS